MDTTVRSRDEDFVRIAGRIDTLSLQAGDMPTRALVVFNTTTETIQGRARFAATFPMRREACPAPVTLRDSDGRIVPSHLNLSDITESANLPAGRVLWTMELEFIVESVPAGEWRTFAAVFGFSPESQSENVAFFETFALFSVPVIETNCHTGDLPLAGSINRLQ